MSSGQGDRTEKATPKRKKDAREKGQVVRSRDLAGAISLVAVTLSLGWFGAWATGVVGGRLADGLNRVSDGARGDITPQMLAAIIWPDLGLLAKTAGPPAMVALLLSAWRQRGLARHQLHSLNDHMLRDMGLTRREFERTGRSGRLD